MAQQPVSDDIKTDILDDTEHVSLPQFGSTVEQKYDIKLEKGNTDEQRLFIPLGITREVSVIDDKPEHLCNIKQENFGNITESSGQGDRMSSSFCQSKEECESDLYVDEIAITEQLEELYNEQTESQSRSSSNVTTKSFVKLKTERDDQLDPLGITTEVAVLDVNRELQCRKHENANNITELFAEKPEVQPDLVAMKFEFEEETPCYLFRNDRYLIPESSDGNLKEAATLEGQCIESKVAEATEMCHDVNSILLDPGKPGQTQDHIAIQCEEAVDKHSSTKHDDGGFENIESSNNRTGTFSSTEVSESPHGSSEIKKVFSCKTNSTGHSVTSTDSSRFPCHYCQKPCISKQALTRHVRIHTSTKLFSCNQCDRQFRDNYRLTIHLRTHTGEKPFPCPHCDKRFTEKGNVAKHIRMHTGEKPFSCYHCDKRFNGKSSLTAHIRTHTGEKPFSCDYCDERFSDKSGLSRHVRIHTGEKPFSCPHCNKRFSAKRSLSGHILRHIGEKPFCCLHCDKRFSDSCSLSTHIRRQHAEKPFSCYHCDKRFSDKCHLTSHMRKHTGEKPFSCHHCDKRYGEKSYLTLHIRKHTGEKPFSCLHCHKGFRDKSNLTRHVRTHSASGTI